MKKIPSSDSMSQPDTSKLYVLDNTFIYHFLNIPHYDFETNSVLTLYNDVWPLEILCKA